MPQSVKFEYKTSEGGWAEVPNAEGKGCESDKYNTTTLGNIQTTGLRMTMEPQAAEGSASAPPAHSPDSRFASLKTQDMKCRDILYIISKREG